MNKLTVSLLTLFILSGCSTYGLSGQPNSPETSNNSSTVEEEEALNNLQTFPLAIKDFEENILNNDKNKVFYQTNKGINTSNDLIEVVYKSKTTDDNQRIETIYIFIDIPGNKVKSEDELVSESFDIIFKSLGFSVEVENIIGNIHKEKTELFKDNQMSVEMVNYLDNIQINMNPLNKES